MQKSGTKAKLSSSLASSPAFQKYLSALHKFLYSHLYEHPKVKRMSENGANIIKTLFQRFRSSPKQMPTHYQQLIPDFGLERSVADYIAGMTDRFARELFKA